jgi:hypothetical protein
VELAAIGLDETPEGIFVTPARGGQQLLFVHVR